MIRVCREGVAGWRGFSGELCLFGMSASFQVCLCVGRLSCSNAVTRAQHAWERCCRIGFCSRFSLEFFEPRDVPALVRCPSVGTEPRRKKKTGVRTVSDPRQPSRSGKHVMRRCIACHARQRIAMTHFRNTSADEERLHVCVMDYCSPSQGCQQGITVPVVKEMKTKADSAFMAPSKELDEYLVKVVADFMSACGCGRAILKSDGEPSIVALQEAVKNARQSDTILENSPKGDSQSNGAAEGMIRTWKVFRSRQIEHRN